MKTSTVAKRTLQDATRCKAGWNDCECIVYLWPKGYEIDPARPICRCTRCQTSDLITYGFSPGILPGDACFYISMSSITVDGYRTKLVPKHGTYMFNFRDDLPGDWCIANEAGLCICTPRDYYPESYKYGEICEPCWLKLGRVVGIGYGGCAHDR